ncbi:hypothetical protein LXL04_007903 [Taraxacum kok-saghyz]
MLNKNFNVVARQKEDKMFRLDMVENQSTNALAAATSARDSPPMTLTYRLQLCTTSCSQGFHAKRMHKFVLEYNDEIVHEWPAQMQ